MNVRINMIIFSGSHITANSILVDTFTLMANNLVYCFGGNGVFH